MEINRHSDTWRVIEAHITQQIEICRVKLEMSYTGERDTSILRGEILAYRDILKLAEPKTERKVIHPLGY